MQLILISLEEIIPDNHLLKQIDKHISFNFIYEKIQSYYSNLGRKSIDPICMIKMLLVGYLYGIKSERRLVEEIRLNIAYRWFCGFELSDTIPDHSLFSQNRSRRFHDSTIFQEIFNHIVRLCIEKGIVTGETVVSDGTFIPANVAWESRDELIRITEKSAVDYLDVLNEELSNTPGYVKGPVISGEKKILKSRTDKDCGYVNQPRKTGLGYLS